MTVAIAAIGAMAVLGAVSAIAEGQQAKAAHEHNAALAMQEAEAVEKQAAFERAKLSRQKRRLLSRQRAAAGAQGSDFTGSLLDIAADTAQQFALDDLAIKYNADVGAAQARGRARVEEIAGDQAVAASGFRAATSLLAGAAGIGKGVPVGGMRGGTTLPSTTHVLPTGVHP